MPFVLFRKHQRHANFGPCYAERGVVKAHAAVCRSAVEVVALVGKERVVLQYDEAVGKPARYEELLFVLGRQLDAEPLAVRSSTVRKLCS